MRKTLHDSPSALRVLGLDPGTATTGWAILEEKNGYLKSLAYGCISTSSKNLAAQRIKEIANDLEKIIKKYQPDEAAGRRYIFFQKSKNSDKSK